MSEEKPERPRGSTEKIWDATRKTMNTATFRANQYKRIVQKKIDLNSIHKKIAAAQADLGKLVDEYREHEGDILAREEVQALFRKLDDHKNTATQLEAEIEALKNETPPSDEEAE